MHVVQIIYFCIFLFSLQTVSSFRSEIIKKASLNVFKDLEKNKSPISQSYKKKVKGQESFPEPFWREKKKGKDRRGTRYKTLPVTLAELTEVPDSEPITKHCHLLHKRQNSTGESDLDLDRLVAINIKDAMALSPTSPVRNTSGNQAFNQQAAKSVRPGRKLGVKRFQDRKKRSERSLTQPITEEEVKEAAEMSNTTKEEEGKEDGKAKETSTSESGDELSK